MSGGTGWDGDDYARRMEERLRQLESSGGSRHGEADLVHSLEPATVLDAGCGTGRVAVELARRGVAVVAVDVDPSMLAKARAASDEVEWVEADLTTLDLAKTFDVVVMAGNVPLFTPPGTEGALVRRAAAHVAAGGCLVAGFQLDRGYRLSDYDGECRAAGLVLSSRWSTWEGDSFDPTDGAYAVSVHHRPPS